MNWILCVQALLRAARAGFGGRNALLLWGLGLVSLQAAAQAAGAPAMEDIMAAAADASDRSMAIFRYLLGDFWDAPFSAFMSGTVSGAGGIVGAMFLIFNGCVFVVGVAWGSWGLLNSVLETANSGEVLGRRLNGVMLPIRMTLGVSGMAPLFAGFSLAQVYLVMMTVVGIGIANLMYAGALLSLRSFDGLMPRMSLMKAGGRTGFEDVASNLMSMYVCEQSKLALESETGLVADNDRVRRFPILTDTSTGLSIGLLTYADMCGSVKVTVPSFEPASGRWGSSLLGYRVDSVNYSAHVSTVGNAYRNGLSSLQGDVKAVADKWVTEFREFSAGGRTAPPPYPKMEIIAAATKYADSIKTEESLRAIDGGAIKDSVLNSMKKDGWIGAGAWFGTYAEATSALSAALDAIKFETVPPLSREASEGGAPNRVLETLQSLARATTVAGGGPDGVSPASSGGSGEDVLSHAVCGGTGGIMVAATGNVSLGQCIVSMGIDAASVGSAGGRDMLNPIIMFKNMGDWSMTIGGILMAANGLVGESASSPGDKGSSSLLGKAASGAASLASKAVSWTAGALLQVALALGRSLMIAGPYFLIIGMLMAIYIPMIPFITWMGAVIQYVTVVLQGLVGMPVAALAHMDVEGDGLGRRSEAGWMFSLNVLMRPALMLLGFFAASGLMIVIGSFQADLFLAAMANAQGNSVTGIFSILGWLTLFFIMNVTLIQGLYNMVFLFPDQILGMVGSNGAVVELGREAEGKMYMLFGGLGRTMQGMQGGRVPRPQMGGPKKGPV